MVAQLCISFAVYPCCSSHERFIEAFGNPLDLVYLQAEKHTLKTHLWRYIAASLYFHNPKH